MLNNKLSVKCTLCSSERWRDVLNNPSYVIKKCEYCGCIRTILIDKKYGISNKLYSSPTEAKKHFETQRDEFSQFAKDILDMVQKKHDKLLDVGCGFGWVVSEANKRGFDAMGIDSSKVYVALGKKTLGANLIARTLENFKTKEKFDVIILNHVLEHIKEPVKFLDKVKSLLVPGGEVFIACPNINSLMFWLFKDRWYGLQPAQHISQFTPETLSGVVEKTGFKTVDIETNSLYYNPPGIKKYAFFFLTTIAELFGVGDQIVITAKSS